ncbi:MAG: tetratricopeptide repeat protein [Labilithrix sp.]|nr:tetratricopeptide repeat protein [Labilithrix sp.]
MTPRAKIALATMALIAVMLAVYAPVRRGAFVYDDHALVEKSRGSMSGVLGRPFWTADPMSDLRPTYYRPLVVLSLRFDALLDDTASGYHVTNLALHALAIALFVIAARRLGASGPETIAAAALWSLAPRLTESVAWVSGRTDVLAACFSFAAVALWPWYGGKDGERSDHARAAGASVALFGGLLSKEVAGAAAIAIAIATVHASRRVDRKIGRLAYVAAPIAVYAALRTAAGGASRATPLGAGARAATMLEAVGRYAEMIVDPWHPASSIGLVGEIDVARAIAGGLVVALASVLVVRAWRARVEAASVVGGALALFGLAPVVHLLPIGLASAVVADRLLYVPLAGLALALARAASALGPRAKRAAAVGAAALVVSFAPVTRARAADYTSELTYRVAAAERAHPHNTAPLTGLAWVLREWGAYDLSCRLQRSARATLDRTGRAGIPRHARALENLAGCYALIGAYDEAASIYAELLSRDPNAARVHMELGFLQMHRFDLDGAEASFSRALSLEPALEPARRALDGVPRLREALAALSTADAREARPVAWASLLGRLGRRPDAVSAWSRIADDPTASPEAKRDAARFLLLHADAVAARRAVDAYAASGAARDVTLEVARDDLALRERRHAAVASVQARIEALARDGDPAK